jgi:hypothetical protein
VSEACVDALHEAGHERRTSRQALDEDMFVQGVSPVTDATKTVEGWHAQRRREVPI